MLIKYQIFIQYQKVTRVKMPHQSSLLKDRDQLLVNLGFGHFNVLHAHMGARTVIPGATDIFHILVCQCPTLTVILTNGALTYQD